MKRLIILSILIMIAMPLLGSNSDGSNHFFKPVIDYYNIGEDETAKVIPFGMYMNEAGVLVGAFYYNTALLNNKAKTTMGLLYSPSSSTSTFWADLFDVRTSAKSSFYGTVSLVKFNNIRIYWKGNDSPNYEVSTVISPETGAEIPTTKGYDNKEGWSNYAKLGWKHDLFNNSFVFSEYRYEMSSSKEKDYSSDTFTLGVETTFVDNISNPHRGFKAISSIRKSLNMLGHNAENDWDYYKLNADLMSFIPITKRSTLALRAYTETTGGKEVVDQQRTQLLHSFGEEEDYTEVAPFFDQALLGNFTTFRGYYYYRFRDNHLLLFQSEYRFPLYGDRLQGVLFGEIGRVAPEYDLNEFFTDMKTSYGAGLRIYFNDDIMIRADFGNSDEELFQTRINFGHSF